MFNSPFEFIVPLIFPSLIFILPAVPEITSLLPSIEIFVFVFISKYLDVLITLTFKPLVLLKVPVEDIIKSPLLTIKSIPSVIVIVPAPIIVNLPKLLIVFVLVIVQFLVSIVISFVFAIVTIESSSLSASTTIVPFVPSIAAYAAASVG